MNEQNKNQLKLSVVLPAYNEEANLLPVINDSRYCLDASELKEQYELIVVNDGSTDNSATILDALSKEHVFIKIIHHPKNMGLGQALLSGFNSASGEYVSFLPTDGEIKIEEILKFYEQTKKEKADILVSKRVCSNIKTQKLVRPWYREIFTWSVRALMHFFLRFDPTDMEGVFLIKKEILKHITFRTRNNMIFFEVIIYCIKHKLKMAKGITTIHPRLSGTSKTTNIRAIWKTFSDILRLGLQK